MNHVQGLIATSVLVLASFVVGLGSMDPDREEVYATIEEVRWEIR
jgi:hypothetical protein